MKFTHGIWFNREHTLIYNATEVAAVTEPEPGLLRALCTTKHVRHNGDTLNEPTITVKIRGLDEGIIACSATHFSRSGRAEPRFPLFPDSQPQASPASKVVHDSAANLATVFGGSSSATLTRNSSAFNIAYKSAEGKVLTNVGYHSLQYVVAPERDGVVAALEASTNIADPYYRGPVSRGYKPHMVVSLMLAPGEYVYGLGERFGPFIKNGQEIDLWNEDAGTCAPYTYKNVPFYMTNRGYGVFFDHSDVLSFEVQNERLAKVQVSVQGEEIRWIVIDGPTPKHVLQRYAILTGKSSLPPPWSFGLYLSTSFITSYDEATVTDQLDGMAKYKIPLSVLHFDCFWMRAHSWTNFTFDPSRFPDAKGFLTRLHERGLKVCVWINAYIAQDSEVFEYAADKGYLIKRVDGTVWQSDIWQAGMGIVDFTNPEAVQWYKSQLHDLLDLGVDTFKTDFGERIPFEDVKFHNGMDPRGGHNYYALLYNEAVYQAIADRRGPSEALLFARAATAGGQRLPVHWGGDCESTWAGMAQSMRGGLSLGLSGFGFWSHDISGFIAEGLTTDVPDAAIYKRWVQFGLLSSHSRLHGSHTYRVPWTVDEEACHVLGKFARLKNMLMPYVYAQAVECCSNGLPMLRAMLVEFPDDRNCHGLDMQYMFGSDLLVAPVFDDTGECEFYVPAGAWTGLLDGKVRVGPAWYKEQFDSFHLPLLVREDAVILLGSVEERPDYDWASKLTKAVVGKTFGNSGQNKTWEIKVPSFSQLGQYEGTVKITASGQGDSGQQSNTTTSFEVETTNGVAKPEILVLDESSHL